MNVLIAGAGIGGLLLGQGLEAQGIPFTIFERDASSDERSQGYRLNINADGGRAMSTLLPDRLWQSFLATAGQANDGFEFATSDLRTLVYLRQKEINASSRDQDGEYPTNRAALRTVLMSGLENRVSFGKPVLGFDETADKVVARFEDGSEAEGDVLVGADGVRSAIRAQLLPDADLLRDTGVVALAGKVAVDHPAARKLPERFMRRLSVIMPPADCAMFLAQFRFRPHDRALSGFEEAIFETMRESKPAEYIFWALLFRADHTGDPRRLNNIQQLAAAKEMVKQWHPDLRDLVHATEPHSLLATTMQYTAPLPAWQSSRVTLLGDAAHTMPPVGGLGGNTAMRDAALLVSLLGQVKRGQLLGASLDTYRNTMRAYSERIVRTVVANTQMAITPKWQRAFLKSGLRITNAILPARKGLIASMFQEGVGT